MSHASGKHLTSYSTPNKGSQNSVGVSIVMIHRMFPWNVQRYQQWMTGGNFWHNIACFNCARGSHEAQNCYSRSSCRTCKRRHHTYICDWPGPQQELALTTSEKGDGIFPVVNLKVSVIECRVLINTGAGSSYILVNRIGLLMIKPVIVEVKQVDMLMGTSMAPLETWNLGYISLWEFQNERKLNQGGKGRTVSNRQLWSSDCKVSTFKGSESARPRHQASVACSCGAGGRKIRKDQNRDTTTRGKRRARLLYSPN